MVRFVVRTAPQTTGRIGCFVMCHDVGCVIYIGGGTGGHLMPGIAIAERVQLRAPEIEQIFICADKPLDAEILTKAGYKHFGISAKPFPSKPFPGTVISFIKHWRASVRETTRIINDAIQTHGKERVCVVTMGGYIAAPGARAASQRKIPVLLVNLDVVPGKANRLIARLFADTIVSAVPVPNSGKMSKFSNVPILGMPVRQNAIAHHVATDQATCRTTLGLAPDRPTLLITGASQGAGTLNDLIKHTCTDPSWNEVWSRWQLLHLCGQGRADNGQHQLEQFYRDNGVCATVLEFCDTMGLAWGSADIALSRAGASSVAEAAINNVPAVFVPYPWHRDQHQKHNAQPVVDIGGGWLCEDYCDVKRNMGGMGILLRNLMQNDEERKYAKAQLASQSDNDAAAMIAETIIIGN